MILALGHASGTGKDTAASILVERHGFTRLSFADAVRAVTYDTQPAIRRIVDEWGWEDAKRTYPQVRQALVAVGASGRKHLGTDVWVMAALRNVERKRDYCISDLRYLNEVEAVKTLDGTVVKITRPGVQPLPDQADQGLAHFDGWDYVIANDGSLDDLAAKLGVLVDECRPTVRHVDMTGYFPLLSV